MLLSATHNTGRRRRRRRTAHRGHIATALLFTALPCHALFGFGNKRFSTSTGLVDAGGLGLDTLGGTIAAFGDWNADQFMDVFRLSADRRTVDVLLWDHAAFTFTSKPAASITTTLASPIVNLVASDFNYDGQMDLLVMAQSQSSSTLDMELWIGKQGGAGFEATPLSVPSSTSAQPLVWDAAGDMRADLLAHPSSSSLISTSPKAEQLSLWRNNFTPDSASENITRAFTVDTAPLGSASRATGSKCSLAHLHSSAFIDLNGDCLADLFLVCSSSTSSTPDSYEIWTANPSTLDNPAPTSTFSMSRSGQLPFGTEALSFADMDRDGTIDVIFPTCTNGGKCTINIAYNRQIPLCSQKANDGGLFGGRPTSVAVGGRGLNESTESTLIERVKDKPTCRLPENLCSADDSFRFDFTASTANRDLAQIPLSALLPSGSSLLLTDDLLSAPRPVPLALGDFNKDGYPDVLLITKDTSSISSSSPPRTTVHLLENVVCYQRPSYSPFGSKPVPLPGCSEEETADPATTRRSFRAVTEGAKVLEQFDDVRSASWLDVDEDGTLDIMLTRLPLGPGSTKPSNERRTTFIQNSYFHDAFFLKVLALNGACQGYCEPDVSGAQRYRPWGVNYAGASLKFTVLDTNGQRRAQAVGQLPQTSYAALLTPASYFGLGRTNNYVESLFVGSTRSRTRAGTPSYLAMEGVIPNSQVVVLPWEGGRKASVGAGGPHMWSKELYLKPGEWIPWVTGTLVAAILGLMGFVAVLSFNEKREDEKERKRAVHAINFDAL